MLKKIYRKVEKLMILFMVILLCGTLPMQAFATEIPFVAGSTIEESLTINQYTASPRDDKTSTEEVLTEEGSLGQEEDKDESVYLGQALEMDGVEEEIESDQEGIIGESAGREQINQEETDKEVTNLIGNQDEDEIDLEELSKDCLVVFDTNNGKMDYRDFYKVMVPINGTVSHQPKDPTRDGYLFNGWYAYLDESGEPVHWDFKRDIVTENTTLWADWEKGCLVVFDPDDGKTGYNNFYKVTLPIDSTVTSQPKEPVREGYFFNGWYAYLDENGEPVHWDFEMDKVMENTTLWADWEKGCLVVFDPDDGKIGYNNFYKVTLPIDSTVTSQPEAPVREGYFFNGWYAYLDESGEPVHWDFEMDKVMENTTLWADWEKGCLVVFDPDDGKTEYNNFYKVTLPINSTVTSQPEAPVREGYLFNGWYAYLDESGEPVHWDFEMDKVIENTTLWADWEKGCLVVFDPDDGKTEYNNFYKVTLPINSTVTSQPEAPVRDGYLFNGWYAYLDESGEPVLWDFEKDTVTENTTLWAAWDIDSGSNGGGNDGGNSGGNDGGNSGGNDGGSSGGNDGGSSGGNDRGNSGGKGEASSSDNNGLVGNISGDNEFVLIDYENALSGYHAFDSLPITGYNNFNYVLLWGICCTSALGIIMLITYRQKVKLLKENVSK